MSTPSSSPSRTESIAWDEVIKKEARGAVDDSDFGEVQEVGQHYVMTEKGILSKKKYYIPKYLVQGYDGDTLWFNASDNELQEWARDYAPGYDEYTRYKQTTTAAINTDNVEQGTAVSPPTLSSSVAASSSSSSLSATDLETRIPLIEERLKVQKTESISEVSVKKVPRTETKTVEVPVTKEELVVETRPVAEGTATADSPVTSETEQKVQLKEEHVTVTKEPYVKEEVVLKKKPITETKTVSDTVTREEVDVSGETAEKEIYE